MAQSRSGDAERELSLLLGSEAPNRQVDTSCLNLAKELRMQADCQGCPELALKAHTYLIRQKHQSMLSRWKAAGCPDPGLWPDLHTDLFLVSYLRMAAACGPNDQGQARRDNPNV
jgi:hypothetical protein